MWVSAMEQNSPHLPKSLSSGNGIPRTLKQHEYFFKEWNNHKNMFAMIITSSLRKESTPRLRWFSCWAKGFSEETMCFLHSIRTIVALLHLVTAFLFACAPLILHMNNVYYCNLQARTKGTKWYMPFEKLSVIFKESNVFWII